MPPGLSPEEPSSATRRALGVAMVVYGDITLDSRVQREANALTRAGHLVTIFCLGGSDATMPMLDSRVEVVNGIPDSSRNMRELPSPFHEPRGQSRIGAAVERAGWLIGYSRNLRAWGRAVTRTRSPFDVWHAHDFPALAAVAGSKPRGDALVYDVHDLFTETGTGARLPGLLRAVLRLYERQLVRHVNVVVSVNQGLADVIQKQCKPRSIVVVHNCVPVWQVPAPRPNLIREATGIPHDVPVVLYHGVLGGNRGLDRLCEAVLEPGLDDVHVALLGFGPHRDRLASFASQPRFAGRVHILDAVRPAELLPWIASADVGAMALPNASLNLYLSTPNKLFECLAAGLPVVVSDFPEVRRIVLDDPVGPLGVVCDPSDVKDVARALLEIIGMDARAREDLGRRCATAARERWNWESESQVLVAAYERLADARHSIR